jgi:hypothetical protein
LGIKKGMMLDGEDYVKFRYGDNPPEEIFASKGVW